MKIPLQGKCRSDAMFLLNRFTIYQHYSKYSLWVAKRAPSQISYPNNLVPSELLLLSAADGTAGSCLLNLFKVSNDLGSAFLDGFAVGTHNKAA